MLEAVASTVSCPRSGRCLYLVELEPRELGDVEEEKIAKEKCSYIQP